MAKKKKVSDMEVINDIMYEYYNGDMSIEDAVFKMINVMSDKIAELEEVIANGKLK